MDKAADAFRTISEAAEDLGLPQHVLRFWETRFPQIKPLKRAGGRRFYRPADVRLLVTIRRLLYEDGYTIKGVQRLLKEQGLKVLQITGTAGASVAANDPELSRGGEAGPADRDAYPAEPSGETPLSGKPLLSEELPVYDEHPSNLREVLAMITECEAILHAASGTGLAS